ncbi:ParB/RepB/Spo0J family partition protein [Pelomonas sp. V22]|uniref:ParB/RepB/Spo0J family partition protein n=1 Tax=Pelomonas sp. V22 TaxID=2822139 RepID=UPI0024A8485E|nr:ParB/RepB/Spo0J family partition protein [Pelomonas sp. V22]MDI4635900.1 ParB/RepB/Spo0J family partition protein [Pelomonas sp. V22]
MSLKDKASRINFGSLPDAASSLPEAGVGGASKPKTAPGLMMAQAADQRSELLRENEDLKERVAGLADAAARATELQEELKAWDGAKAARQLDPACIGWSTWANRDESNFSGPEYAELKAEIASAGGNVQPIKVRVVKPGTEGHEYEIVFGHRRHRACLELGLPVLALIDNLGEADLFVQMDRENRGRKNLSALEQGRMYQRALDRGLFPSNRKLADAVGADLAQVGKALSLARLPSEVIAAFASPLDLQFRWAKLLADANDKDPIGLKARALKAREMGATRSGKEVLDVLLKSEGQGGGTVLPAPIVVEGGGKPVATIEVDSRGRTTVAFASEVVPGSQLRALAELVEGFLSKISTSKN